MTNEPSLAQPAASSTVNGSPEEQTRLDDAIRRADELLVTSLKSEERRRNRCRIIVFSLGALIMLTALCLLLFSWAGDNKSTAADQQQATQLSQDGWDLWKTQQYSQAIDKFQEAVKLDPKNVEAWNGLGWSQFNSGSHEPAMDAFQHALRLEPNYPASQNGIGQILLLEGKLDRAKEHLEKAAPQASAAWYGLARISLLQANFDDAAKWAQKVIDSGEADDTMKQILRAAKEKKVSAELRRQIEPPPAEKPSIVAKDLPKAWQLMNQGRRDQAKAIFDAALAKSPNDAAVLNGLGWFYLFGGSMDEAKPYFEKAMKADPNAAGAMNGLARVLHSEGKMDDAIKLWEQMVEKFPGPNAGTFGLADAYMEKKEFKKAVPLFEQLAKANPQDEEIKNKLTRAKDEASK